MIRLLQSTIFVLLTWSSIVSAQSTCEDVLDQVIADVELLSSEAVAEPVDHCKVKGRIGRNIHFSVWLPSDWNGRFVMGGAGGFVRPEDNHALRMSPGLLEKGYATASTDTGHQAHGFDSRWALNDYEAIVNYGHLAMHRAVAVSKAVIRNHYGAASDKSFFFGCSNGGRQALMEAQRYPDDFDAIIAGAPAANWTGVGAAFVDITRHMFPDPDDLSEGLVTAADRNLLRASIESACDEIDGVKDGILADPTACEFNVASLACTGESAPEGCLSQKKIDAIQSIYNGPRTDKGPLFFGFPFGAEATDENGWGFWLSGGLDHNGSEEARMPSAAYAFGMGLMRNFVMQDADWSYQDVDWNSYPAQAASIAATLNAVDPDLSAFRARGGKLLMFHGWADVALTAHMSTNYIDRVYSLDPSARDDARLFMMPGVLHCAGGTGPSFVDWLGALERWHESGNAPDSLTAIYPDKPGARRLCAWPLKAVYLGGDSENEDSYRCQ